MAPPGGPSPGGFHSAPQAFGSSLGFPPPSSMESDGAVHAIAKILEAVVPQLAQRQSSPQRHHHHNSHHHHPMMPPILVGGPRVPLEPPEEIVTLWIGNVPPGTSDEELAAFFKPYGTLVCCFLLKLLSRQGHLSGFVRYATKQEASIALEAVNNGAVVVNGQVASAKWASQNSKPLNNPSLATGLQMSLNGEDPGYADQLPEKPSLEPPPPDEYGEEITTLWIGNALPGTRDDDMLTALSPYGVIVCCFLLKKLSPQGQLSGFVRYSTQMEARYALEALTSGRVIVNSSVITAKWASHNSKPLGDKATATLLEQLPGSPPIGPTGEEITTLWVGNVDPNTTDNDFVNTMVSFGPLMCCFLLRSVSPQGQKSGFARYVTALGAASALQAIESGSVSINGQVLKARWAKENSKPLGEK